MGSPYTSLVDACMIFAPTRFARPSMVIAPDHAGLGGLHWTVLVVHREGGGSSAAPCKYTEPS